MNLRSARSAVVSGPAGRSVCAGLAACLTAVVLVATSAGAYAAPSPPSTTAAPTTTTPPTTAPSTTTAPTTPTTAPSTGGAPTPPTPQEPLLPDPTPKVHALLATLQAMDLAKLMPGAVKSVASREAAAQRAQQAVVSARGAVTDAKKTVAAIKQHLGALAIEAYVGPQREPVSVILASDPTENGRRTVLLQAALANEQQRLADAQAAVTTAQRQLVAAQATASSASADVQGARSVVGQLQQREDELRNEAATAVSSPDASWQLTIEGDSEFTAPELASWFATQHVVPKAQVSVAKLAQYYIDEGKDEGIRGDVAFAQSIVETGSFTNPDTVKLNNFAGIGHCDSCKQGFGFASPQLGVRAQIQLLKSYAEVFPTYKHPLVDPRLKGPAGCCATWNKLTRVWATDQNYGPVILGTYQKMLEWLIVERGGQIPAGA